MKRFKNILVVYNGAVGSEDALTQAVMLARTNRANLTLVDVLHPSTVSWALCNEREKLLERIVNHLKLDGVNCAAFMVRIGSEPDEIINQVIRGQHDIVIASAEGGNAIRNALYGKTAVRLIRKCPCPVWLLKPDHSLQFGRVLAAVDPDPNRPECDTLNTKIMDLSTSLAVSYNAELHLLHAWEVLGKDRDTLCSELRDKTRDSLLEKHLHNHKRRVEDLLCNYRLEHIRHSIHLPRDMPERAILKTVNDEAIDLIVIGESSRSGLAGLLNGHAAEAILSAVRGGVLTVKPASMTVEQSIEMMAVA